MVLRILVTHASSYDFRVLLKELNVHMTLGTSRLEDRSRSGSIDTWKPVMQQQLLQAW